MDDGWHHGYVPKSTEFTAPVPERVDRAARALHFDVASLAMLRLLLARPDGVMSREVEHELGMAYPSVRRRLRALEDAGLVAVKHSGDRGQGQPQRYYVDAAAVRVSIRNVQDWLDGFEAD